MPSRAPVPAAVQQILDLARRDRLAASRVVAEQPLQQQVELVCETPVALRSRVLDLLPEPEKVIPELPEAELCFTAKALGLEDAGWILEHATAHQLVTALDLDGWRGMVLEPAQVSHWMKAIGDAGPETLARTAAAIDPELLVLYLKARIEVWLKPSSDDWEPAEGSRSLDSQFYFRARQPGDDLEDVGALGAPDRDRGVGAPLAQRPARGPRLPALGRGHADLWLRAPGPARRPRRAGYGARRRRLAPAGVDPRPSRGERCPPLPVPRHREALRG
jgi:hypothetical protein